MLRNNASGPGIGLPGRILAGLLPGKHRNRISGRPSAGRRADVGSLPVAVRPKSGPEGRRSQFEFLGGRVRGPRVYTTPARRFFWSRPRAPDKIVDETMARAGPEFYAPPVPK